MKKQILILFLIFLIGFLLRFINLSSIPPELNRDEAALGYNAYSVLETSRDEHGKGPWPLVFRSFGDYKLPGYIYLLIPLIKIGGLNAFTVRLPSAFFGTLTILIVFLLTKELFPFKTKLAFITALILAISPFHLHYSRQAFETNVALFFNLTAIFLILKSRKNKKFLFLSLPFIMTALLIYNTPLFIVIPLSFWTFLVNKKNFINNQLNKILTTIFIVLLLAVGSGSIFLLKEANQGKSNTTIFNQITTEEQINHNIFYLNKKGFPIILARIFYNKPFYWSQNFLKNYLAAFNPKFIFLTGDNNPWHSLGYLNFGNLLVVFLPFLLIGIFNTIKNIEKKEYAWVLGYWIIAGIINGFTIDSPILSRLLDFHICLVIITSLGLFWFWNWHTVYSKLKNLITFSLITYFSVNYLLTYFFVFPQDPPDFWLPGIKQASQVIKKEEKNYDLIFFDANVELSYIFLAFYLPFDPTSFQQNSKREMDGFDTVVSFDKFIFNKNINNSNDFLLWEKQLGYRPEILLVHKLNKEANLNVSPLNNEIIIYDGLKRGLWKTNKIIF